MIYIHTLAPFPCPGGAEKTFSACPGAFGGSVWCLGERGAGPGAAGRCLRAWEPSVAPSGVWESEGQSRARRCGAEKAFFVCLGAIGGFVWRPGETRSGAGRGGAFSAGLNKRKAGYVKYIHISRLLSQWFCPWVNIIHESFWPNTSPKQSRGDWPFSIFTCK